MVLHAFASFSSVGQTRPGLNINQPETISIIAENKKTQILYFVRIIRKGKRLVNDTMVLPIPNNTKTIGSVQHNKVPVVENSVKIVKKLLFNMRFTMLR